MTPAPKATAARVVALEVVTRVREREAYAHETLDAVLRAANLQPQDAAFATRLAYGAIAMRGTLEEAVMRGLDAGTRIEESVMDALVMGAYEILFASTPAHAAVSETVELVRSRRPKASGLANAALRRLIAAAPEFPWGDPATDVAALARLHGHPQWMTELIVGDLGRAAATQMLEADNEAAPFFVAAMPHRLRVDELKEALGAEGIGTHECPVDGCIRVDSPARARTSAVVTQRKALVMDAGAQFTVMAADVPGVSTVIELGAGRGSKSLLLASRAAGRGESREVCAVDVHDFKLSELTRAAAQVGLPELRTVTADARDADSLRSAGVPVADVVLVDAPCSGLGTLRRHPDRRWRAAPAEIDALAVLGSELLTAAAQLVKPGGFVVYSTCTVAFRENEQVVEGFLESEAGASFTSHPLGELAPEEWAEFVLPEGWFRSHPTIDGPDGHFVARLKRAP